LKPLPGAADNDGLPTAEEEAKPKGKKARKGKGGAVTEEALQAAVEQTAMGPVGLVRGVGRGAERSLRAAASHVRDTAGSRRGAMARKVEKEAPEGSRAWKKEPEKGSVPLSQFPRRRKSSRRAQKGKRERRKGRKQPPARRKSVEMECRPMEETATGRQSVAGEQVTPALEAREGKKAATGVEQSAGMVCPPREEGTAGLQSSVGVVTAPVQEVRVPPVGPVGQPVAQFEGFEAGSEEFEAESDDFENVFSVETE
jgi:hypothetical protein